MITQEENRKIVEKMFFFFQDYFKIDIVSQVEQVKEGKLSFQGTLSQFQMMRDLQRTIAAYLKGEVELARINGRNQIIDILHDYSVKATTAEAARYASKFYAEAAECLEGYEEFFEEDRQLLLKAFQNDQLFKKEDYDTDAFKKLSRLYLNDIEEQFSEQRKTFRTYCYKRSNYKLPQDSLYTIKDHILITDSLEGILLSLKPQQDDLIHLAVFLKIEPEVDFSYFIISVQYKDSIWLSSDFIELANPSMQQNRRNPRRISEKRERYNELPYFLIDEVIKWRQESNYITKKAGQEVYSYKIFDLDTYSRIMFSYMFKHILSDIFVKQFDFETIFNAQHAISLYSEEPNELEYFSKTNKEALEEFLADYAFEEQVKSTELAVTSKALATTYEKHNRLLTIDQLQREGTWIKHKLIADQMSKRQEATEQEIKELKKLISDNLEHIYKLAFCGKEVFTLDVDRLNGLSHFGVDRSKEQLQLYRLVKEGAESYCMRLFHTTDTEKVLYRHNYTPFCVNCHKYETKTKNGITLQFHTHKEMMMLIGCLRTDIPMYYRNYYADSAFPYIGNPLLDNVRPEFVQMYYDPCSVRHRNYFDFAIELCGVCKRRFYSQYKKFEKSVILFSSKKNEVIDILDWNTLNVTLKQKLNIEVEQNQYGIYYIKS